MSKIIFTGKILPEFAKVDMQGHPEITMTRDDGFEIKFRITIVESIIHIECEINRDDPKPYLSELAYKATNLAETAVSLLTFRVGQGLYVVIDSCNTPDGKSRPILLKDPSLEGLAKSISSDDDFARMLSLLNEDTDRALAIRDLAESMRFMQSAPINWARAMDAIRNYFIPENGSEKSGWEKMRENLNASEEYVKGITNASKGPRHGVRSVGPTDPENLAIRTWILMDRFFEFRKRSDHPLPATEFPMLETPSEEERQSRRPADQ